MLKEPYIKKAYIIDLEKYYLLTNKAENGYWFLMLRYFNLHKTL